MRMLESFGDRGGFWSGGFLCSAVAGLIYTQTPGSPLVLIMGGLGVFAFTCQFALAFLPTEEEGS